jgi:hypothetical protein
MGTSVDGVFSTLELAQECEASIKASQEYSDFDITTAINIMQLDDTLYKEIV